jgi:hypothetical protein
MEKILNDMKVQGQLTFEQGVDASRMSDDEMKSMKETLSKDLMRQYDISKDIADKQAAAQMDANTEAGEKAQWQKLYSQIQVDKLTELKGAIGSSLASLGGALKDDFNQITAGFSMIADAPGIKSVIAIITTISSLLGSLLLSTLKRNLSENSFIGKRISMKEGGGVDFTKTLKNFNPFTAFTKDDETSGGEAGAGKKKQKWKDSNRDEGGKFKKMNLMDEFKFNMGTAFSDATDKVKGQLKDTGAKLWKSTEGLRDNPLSRSLGKAGTTMKNTGKKLLKGVARLAMGAAGIVIGMIAAGMSMFIASLPMIGIALIIGLAIAALIKGVMYLRDKFIENKDMIMARWQVIKEGFNIALDGLGIWKDKAVSFISNTFKSIWFSIKGFFVSIMEGIERGINYAIEGINTMIPGERYDLTPVDLGTGNMRAEFEKDKGAFEIKKKSQGEEFERRQQDLLDRKSANTMGGSSSVVQQNNVVNEGDKSTQIIPTGTNPVDVQAGNLAIAQ